MGEVGSKKKIKNKEKSDKPKVSFLLKPPPLPKDLHEYLERHVVGQEKAKKALSVAVYNHYKRLYDNHADDEKTLPNEQGVLSNRDNKSLLRNDIKNVQLKKCNILLHGPSASGKSLLVKKVAECLDVPFVVLHCMVQPNSVFKYGSSINYIRSVFENFIHYADYNIKKAEHGIILLDGIDIISSELLAVKDYQTIVFQGEVLKLLEGTIFGLNGGRKIDTTNILFVASGEFTEVDDCITNLKNKIEKRNNPTDADLNKADQENSCILRDMGITDLINFGMTPELADKFQFVLPFHSLDEVMLLVKILTELEDAPALQFQKMFEIQNVKLIFDQDALEAIASISIERNTFARGLWEILEEVLLDAYFDLPESDIISIRVTKDAVNGTGNLVCIKRQNDEKE